MADVTCSQCLCLCHTTNPECASWTDGCKATNRGRKKKHGFRGVAANHIPKDKDHPAKTQWTFFPNGLDGGPQTQWMRTELDVDGGPRTFQGSLGKFCGMGPASKRACGNCVAKWLAWLEKTNEPACLKYRAPDEPAGKWTCLSSNLKAH